MSPYALAASFASAEVPIDEEHVKPGWVALIIVLLLCVAVYFLILSFLKHSRRAEQPWEGEERGHTNR